MGLARTTGYLEFPRGRSSRRSVFASAFLVWAGVKLLLSLISVVVAMANGGVSVSDRAGRPTTDPAATGFLGVLHHWDSAYLTEIAVHGYFSRNSPSSLRAFFPGFPLLARELSQLFNLGSATAPGVVLAMSIVSSGASLGAAVLLYRLAERLHSRQVACWSVVVLLCGPYSVFLFADYSESLFLVFAIGAWYAAVAGRWPLAGALAGAATFTRINGVFLVVALLVMYLVERKRSGKPLFTVALWWFPVACSGFVAYFLYLAMRTGDEFAWFHAQAQGWGRGLYWPWQAFYQTAGRVLFASTPDRRLQFAFDIVALAAIAVGIWVFVRRREWPEATYLGLTVLAFATSFTFVSAARNSLTLFPLAILVSTRLVAIRSRAIRWGLVTLGASLFLVNTVLFANGYWAD